MAKAVRKQRTQARREVPRWVTGHTPQRAARLDRTTQALWAEMKRWLDGMRGEIEFGGEVVALPILRCRARVSLMLGALRSLEPHAYARSPAASAGFEHCAWFVELQAAMDRWVQATVWDLQDHGVRPAGSARDDRRCFTPEFGVAVGGLFEAYRDWVYTALWRLDLDGLCAVDDLQRSDAELDRIRERMRVRRAMSRRRGRPLQQS